MRTPPFLSSLFPWVLAGIVFLLLNDDALTFGGVFAAVTIGLPLSMTVFIIANQRHPHLAYKIAIVLWLIYAIYGAYKFISMSA